MSFNKTTYSLELMGKTYSDITLDEDNEKNLTIWANGEGVVYLAAGQDEDGDLLELVVNWNNEKVLNVRLYCGSNHITTYHKDDVASIQLVQ